VGVDERLPWVVSTAEKLLEAVAFAQAVGNSLGIDAVLQCCQPPLLVLFAIGACGALEMLIYISIRSAIGKEGRTKRVQSSST